METLTLQEFRRQTHVLRAILHHMPQGISVFDEQLRLIYWNDGFLDVLELPPEVVYEGVPFEALLRIPAYRGEYGPGDPEAQVMARKALALQFQPHRFERTRPNGKTTLVQGTPLIIDNQVAGFITTYTDITDRKQAEEAQQRQHEVLRTLIENLPSAVSFLDADLNFVAYNTLFKTLLDLPDSLFEGTPSLARLAEFNAQRGEYGPGDSAEQVQMLLERARQAEAHHFERTRPNGTVLEVRGVPLPGGGFVTIYSDITERKKAEAADKAAVEALRIAARTFDTHDAIVITDAHQIIQQVNRAFTDITGYSAEEALGQRPSMLSSGHQDEAFYEAMYRTLEVTGQWQGELLDRHKDGHVYPKWLSVTAVRDDAGQISHYVGIFSDISERKAAEARINQLAFYDSLTDLPNRRLLQDRLKHALIASDRSNQYGAVFFLDLDNFKQLNDTKGHRFGDKLLIEVAQRLRVSVREEDTVARLGGDEFVVMMENLGLDAEQAAIHADSIGKKIVAALDSPYLLDEHLHHSSSSVGITLFHGNQTREEDVLTQADTAMYAAKRAGRNTARFFDPSMQRALAHRAELESALRHGLQTGQFCLHYQPQVNDRNQLTGLEALVRWQHPEKGLIPPAEFIPLAEETKLIIPLGRLVLEQACDQILAWQDHPLLGGLPVAVNVSAIQFQQEGFVDEVLATLARKGVAPCLIKLEITESVVIENVETSIATMNRLKAAGIRIAMDDFGTGYSSLSHLKRLPFDQIKIDRSFALRSGTDSSDAIIVMTVISLGQLLHMEVIAEGVESDGQLSSLESIGCRLFQGYRFGRPQAAPDLAQHLETKQFCRAEKNALQTLTDNL